MTRYLTLAVVNTIFLAIVYVLYREGVVATAWQNDILYIVPATVTLWGYGMVIVHWSNRTAEWVCESLIIVGFLGTLFGIVHAFTSVTPESVGDINMIGEVLGSVLYGLGAAIWTTITAAFLALWLSANARVMGG